MKYVLPMLALPLVTLSLSACSDNQSALNKPPGQYTNSTSSTNASGTSTDKTNTTSVGYDANGNKTAITKTKTTVDPPGLFNKSTQTTTQAETAN